MKSKEEIKAYNAAYYQANRDRVMAAAAAYKAANPNAFKDYREKNKDRLSKNLAEWRFNNKEKMSASNAAWRKVNPEARRIIQQNRTAKQRANGGTLSKGIIAKLFDLQGGKCPCCREPLGDNYHLDHIIPIALGGANSDDNVQLLRQRCNNEKYNKHPVDFMQQKGFLL